MYPIDQLFFIDIETVSQQPVYANLDARWQEMWEDKIARQLPEGETPESFYPQRAAILAEFGKIICISAGFFYQPGGARKFRVKSFAGDDEATLLREFLHGCAAWQATKKQSAFAGHNIREFDIPYICRRLLINRIAIPPFLDFQSMKPWETNLLDTMQYWRFGDYKNYTSLNLLAACLGIDSPKSDMDGSQVGKVYWEDHDLQRISDYCRQDVVTVAQVVLRYRNEPLLAEGDIEFV